MGRKDVYKDGENTQFGKGQPTNLGGRKKGNLLKRFAEDLMGKGYEMPTALELDNAGIFLLSISFNDIQDIVKAFSKTAIEAPTKEQKEIQETTPFAVILKARELMGKNGFQVYEKIRDRAHGKAVNTEKQELEIKNTSGVIQINVQSSNVPPKLEE